jgi:hypothetical protein
VQEFLIKKKKKQLFNSAHEIVRVAFFTLKNLQKKKVLFLNQKEKIIRKSAGLPFWLRLP